MLLLLSVLASAAPCPKPEAAAVRGWDVAPNGDAWTLATAAGTTCWWSIDDDGDARVVATWRADAERRPVALAALADGRAALILEDASGWRLAVRHPAGGSQNLAVRLEEPPARLVAHPSLPLVGVVSVADRGIVRVLLVDVMEERVVASATVDRARGAVHFRAQDDRLYLSGSPELAMAADGMRVVADGR